MLRRIIFGICMLFFIPFKAVFMIFSYINFRRLFSKAVTLILIALMVYQCVIDRSSIFVGNIPNVIMRLFGMSALISVIVLICGIIEGGICSTLIFISECPASVYDWCRDHL